MDRSVRRASKLVSDRHRFIQFLVPKVARTSFLRLLTGSEAQTYEARLENEPPQALLSKYPGYTRYAFVRNPWSRIASCWRNKIMRREAAKRWHVLQAHDIEPGMPFAEFVEWLGTDAGSDERADRHWASQHHFVYVEDEPIVDFVGMFEDIENDWADICSRLRLPHETLEKRNASSQRAAKSLQPAHWLDLYTDELVRAVGARYGRDIELFGYESVHLSEQPLEGLRASGTEAPRPSLRIERDPVS